MHVLRYQWNQRFLSNRMVPLKRKFIALDAKFCEWNSFNLISKFSKFLKKPPLFSVRIYKNKQYSQKTTSSPVRIYKKQYF